MTWYKRQTNEMRDRRWQKWVKQDIYQRELAYWQNRAAAMQEPELYEMQAGQDYAGYLTGRKTISAYDGLKATRQANQKALDEVNAAYDEKLAAMQRAYGLNGQDPMSRFLQTYFPEEGYTLNLPQWEQINGLYETLSDEEKMQYAQLYNQALAFEEELAANPQYQADLKELQGLEGRKDTITRGIAGNDYQLAQEQEAYQTALAQNQEMLEILIAMEEEEPGSGTALGQMLDDLAAYGEYQPVESQLQSAWQTMADMGMAQDMIQDQMTSFYTNQEAALEKVQKLIAFAQEKDLPQEYLDNLYRAQAFLQSQTSQARDFGLRYNSDFVSTVAAYKEQNGIVTAMTTEPQPLKGEAENTKHLREDERDAYYYLKATQGDEAAKDYLKRLERTLNYRASNDLAGKSKAFAKDEPVAATALSIAASPAKVAGVFYSLGCWISGEEIDPYHPAFNANVFVEETQGEVKRQIDAIYPEGTFGNLLANLGYGVLTDGTETMLGVALMGPTGAAVVQGMGQASDTLRNVKLRGGSDDQALMRAGASLVVEALTEKLPLDSLSRILKNNDVAGLRKLIGNTLSGGMQEGIGTLISGSLDYLTDEQIMGALSQRKQLMYDSALATASGMVTHGAGTLTAGLNEWRDDRQGFGVAQQENHADVQNQMNEETDSEPPQYKTFTEEEVEEYAFAAIQGSPKADGVMLGRYEKGSEHSYDKLAVKYNCQYFYLEKWDELVKFYGEKQLWRINEKFLDIQTSSGRDIYFSHDPLAKYKPNSGYDQELIYAEE
ncbi:MAG: hypothetical protein IJ461_05890 [Clostridia bacterium]|nr:hypothetical protein [Clostridia bacterium]